MFNRHKYKFFFYFLFYTIILFFSKVIMLPFLFLNQFMDYIFLNQFRTINESIMQNLIANGEKQCSSALDYFL